MGRRNKEREKQKAREAVIATVELIDAARMERPDQVPELPDGMTSGRLVEMSTDDVILYGLKLGWKADTFWRNLPSELAGHTTARAKMGLKLALSDSYVRMRMQ